jgi:glutamyl-tRNA(Gln) amidotransferase subunit E
MTFLDEIDGRVRVIACLTHAPAVLPAPGWLREKAGVTPEDGLLVLAGSPEDCITAAQEIVIRCREAFTGVPGETRQALPGGRTTFERILPGADRMYPDTDLPPEPFDTRLVKRIAAGLPPRPWERREAYAALGVSEQLAGRLINWDTADVFDSVRPRTGYPAASLAWLLTDRRRGSRRAGADWMTMGEQSLGETIVECFEKGVSLKGCARVLDVIARNPGMGTGEAVQAAGPDPVAGSRT